MRWTNREVISRVLYEQARVDVTKRVIDRLARELPDYDLIEISLVKRTDEIA